MDSGSWESSLKRLPDFLIIGAAKSGTTSLYRYLLQHPQIFMPSVAKEPHFFGQAGERPCFTGPGDQERVESMYIVDRTAYAALFKEAAAGQHVGEATATYLYSEHAAEEIAGLIPDARLIAVLRDPVERAYSSYLHLRRDGREPEESFLRALEREPDRIRTGWMPLWHYVAMGKYSEQIRRYQHHFPPDQLLLLRFEDFIADAEAVVRRVLDFVGVDPDVHLDAARPHNVSGIHGSAAWEFVHDLLVKPSLPRAAARALLPRGHRRRLKEWLIRAVRERNLERPPMPPEARRYLNEAFAGDFDRLERLTGLDLSAWRSAQARA